MVAKPKETLMQDSTTYKNVVKNEPAGFVHEKTQQYAEIFYAQSISI